jgi:molecular chaperone GrpE
MSEQEKIETAAEATEQAPVTERVQSPEEELAGLKDRQLRLQADFDNFRRRSARERIEVGARAVESLVEDLLPVLDHFELGLHAADEQAIDSTVKTGFQMVFDQLLGALKKAGLVPLDAHESAFDPHRHEAVCHTPSDEYPPDAIMAQTRRGYQLGPRVIRPVQVVVSSGPGAPADDGEKAAPVIAEETPHGGQ